MRWEEKIPGGKLVCMEVWAEGGTVSRVSITGDFFLHPEERITDIENSLVGIRINAEDLAIAARLDEAIGDSLLIGVSAGDLARIFRKAVGQ